jgi:hypothetical protein
MARPIRLLTIADGFGDSQAVPFWYPDYIKWPEIIQLMTRGVDLCNLSRYGAGNEYIIQCLRQNLSDKDAVLIQWAQPNRLDLVLSHNAEYAEFWNQEIANDPVYKDNVILLDTERMWLSSASTSSGIKEYHKKFISCRQHQIRSQLYIDYATLLLEHIQHGFLLTKNSKYLNKTVDDAHWHWHEPFQGMCEFRLHSKYAELDLDIVQPIPLIQFDFIRQFIQPRFNLPWRNEQEIQAVEKMLYRKYQEAVKNKPYDTY